ncbi:MAG: hypothetical protein ACHQQQ_12585 [Bacteroidota bacterium]
MTGLQASELIGKRILAIVIAGYLLMGCTHYPPKEVVVIERTTSYHRPECSKVMMARTKYVPLTPDISRSYKPCPYCKPESLP